MNSFHQTRKGTKNYQKDMKELQYDMLYGKQYVWNQENPFKATDLQFGIRPLTVTKIYETKDSIFIVGNNFTNFCQVFDGDVKIIQPTIMNIFWRYRRKISKTGIRLK